MKKIFVLALTAALLLNFAACGRDDGGKASDTDTAATTEITTVTDEITSEETTEDTTATTEATAEETTVTTEVTTEETTVSTEPPPVTQTPPTVDTLYPPTVYTPEELAALDTTKNGWGQGVHVDSLNRPTGATWAQSQYGQYGATFIRGEGEKVYLTFDLGYENGYTGKIIDVLNEKGVTGIFFATMHYITSAPDIVQRIVDEGHILANHSVNHLSMPTLSVADMEREIMGLHDYVLENFGYEMYLFRPPMGEFSAQSLAVAQNLGYESVLWSYAYYDYDVNNQPDPASAYERVTGAAHPGAVYLLHAVSATNADILGDVIDYLRESGLGIANEW